MNAFDIDGVITIGLKPDLMDIIITGRSFEEVPETMEYLSQRRILNPVWFNPRPFKDKTRESSGEFKAKMLNDLYKSGFFVGIYFEDDPIQADIIEKACPWLKVVRILHNITEKENVRHTEWQKR